MTSVNEVISKPETILLITQRSGVWNVKINGRFYGDYVRQDWAMEAAREKQREIMSSGGRARVSAA